MRKILRELPIIESTLDEAPEIHLLGPSNKHGKPRHVIRFETCDGWVDVDAEMVIEAMPCTPANK